MIYNVILIIFLLGSTVLNKLMSLFCPWSPHLCLSPALPLVCAKSTFHPAKPSSKVSPASLLGEFLNHVWLVPSQVIVFQGR